MRIILVLPTFVIALISCSHKEYIYLPAASSCLADPPPKERRVEPTIDGCPEQFVYCLERDAGIDMEYNIHALRRWNKEAWNRCAVLDDAGIDGDGGSPTQQPIERNTIPVPPIRMSQDDITKSRAFDKISI